jgi:hypothetical protein
MKCHYLKDFKKRIFLKRIELKKLICLYLIFCNKISILEKYKLYINFFFSKKIKINFELKNHCILTKNTKTVNRFSSLTRSNLKHLINWGMLNGIRKISW